jgi:hypothetical protein
MADNSRLLGGVGNCYVDGVEYDLVSDPTWKVSDRTRASLSGMNRVHGYSETITPGFISATLRDSAGTTVRDFQDMTNVAVTLNLANGKRVSGTGLWTVESQEVNSTEGTFTVRWEGEDIRETR